MKERLTFEPMTHLRLIADEDDIPVRQHSLDGKHWLEDYPVPVNIIIAYLQDPSTEIVESFNDTMTIIIERL